MASLNLIIILNTHQLERLIEFPRCLLYKVSVVLLLQPLFFCFLQLIYNWSLDNPFIISMRLVNRSVPF